MPLAVHAEIHHPGGLNGNAVDAARPLRALDTLRAGDALGTLDTLDALLAGLAPRAGSALVALIALLCDKQPVCALHAASVRCVNRRVDARVGLFADVGAAQPGDLLEREVGLCSVPWFPYLHGGLRLLQRVDGVAHQLRDLGHNFVDFYLELRAWVGVRLLWCVVGVVFLHQQVVRHRDGHGRWFRFLVALNGEAAPAREGQRLRRDGRVKHERVLFATRSSTLL